MQASLVVNALRSRVLWAVWVLLTATSAAICSSGCFLPFWLSGQVRLDPQGLGSTGAASASAAERFSLGSLAYGSERTHEYVSLDGSLWLRQHACVSHMGLFRRCGYPVYTNNLYAQAGAGEKEDYKAEDLGAITWKAGCGYYPSLGAMPHKTWQAGVIILVLACAVLLFLTFFILCSGISLEVLYSQQIRRACAYAHLTGGAFQIGGCEIGWAYVLTISGGVISLALCAMPTLFFTYQQRRLLQTNGACKMGWPPHDGRQRRAYRPEVDRWSAYPLLSLPMDTSAYCPGSQSPTHFSAVFPSTAAGSSTCDSSSLYRMRRDLAGVAAPSTVGRRNSQLVNTRSLILPAEFVISPHSTHRLSLTGSMLGIPEGQLHETGMVHNLRNITLHQLDPSHLESDVIDRDVAHTAPLAKDF
nr:unnamed protein product [Spirometra erinaceieuropaei]